MIVKIKDRDSERKFDCGDVDGYDVNIDDNVDDGGVNINADKMLKMVMIVKMILILKMMMDNQFC